jgi:hypothetical protein
MRKNRKARRLADNISQSHHASELAPEALAKIMGASGDGVPPPTTNKYNQT